MCRTDKIKTLPIVNYPYGNNKFRYILLTFTNFTQRNCRENDVAILPENARVIKNPNISTQL